MSSGLALLVLVGFLRQSAGVTIHGARINHMDKSVELITREDDWGAQMPHIVDFLLLSKQSTTGSNFSAAFTLECENGCAPGTPHVPKWIPPDFGKTVSGLAMLSADLFLKSFQFEAYHVSSFDSLFDANNADVPSLVNMWIEPKEVHTSRHIDEQSSTMVVDDIAWIVHARWKNEETPTAHAKWTTRYASKIMPQLMLGNATHPYRKLHRAVVGQHLAAFIHEQSGRLDVHRMRSVSAMWSGNIKDSVEEASRPKVFDTLTEKLTLWRSKGLALLSLGPSRWFMMDKSRGVMEEWGPPECELLLATGQFSPTAVTSTVYGGISLPYQSPLSISQSASPPAPPPPPPPPAPGTCHNCGGTGSVGSIGWDGGYVDLPCPTCGGTGVEWR